MEPPQRELRAPIDDSSTLSASVTAARFGAPSHRKVVNIGDLSPNLAQQRCHQRACRNDRYDPYGRSGSNRR